MQTRSLALTALILSPLAALAACGEKAAGGGAATAAATSAAVASGTSGGVAATTAPQQTTTGNPVPVATASAGSVSSTPVGMSPSVAVTSAVSGAQTAAATAAPSSAGSGTAPTPSTTGGATGPLTCPYTAPQDPAMFPMNWTQGTVTQFNDNGGWTWYNDERVLVDAAGGKILISSSASSASSQTASPDIYIVIHDLATGKNEKTKLGSLSYSDDHNNGGIVMAAPGEYFVAWAHHNVDCNSYWRKYEGGKWGDMVTYKWAQGCPWGTRPDEITYNNPWNLSSEGKLYNFVRSVETSPNFLLSEDKGKTWKYGGRLTASKQQGYNAGYYKYWGNGVDRVDFFATESHPRDSNTSVYHGYVKGGKSYDSTGKEIDADIFDTTAPEIKDFTRVFAAGSMLGGATLKRLWNFDVARYDDGTVGVLWQGRENECSDKNNCDPKHHMAYSRFDGKEWKSTRLVKGGRTLYRNRTDWWEEDYLGGAALDPDDPHVVYVSTNIDPRDDKTEYPVNEIWKGVTCDNGATFTWTPMTMNSKNENLRPVVPKWDASNSALVWFRGNYQTAQTYAAEVVGILAKR